FDVFIGQWSSSMMKSLIWNSSFNFKWFNDN
ncbi:unnamed protein product, partial [Rotaria sp. Silwood2]